MKKIKSTRLRFLVLIPIFMLVACFLPTSFISGDDPPVIQASLTHDWISISNFIGYAELEISIDGSPTTTVYPDASGNAFWNAGEEGIDIMSPMIIDVYDTFSGFTKDLLVFELSITSIDLENDIVYGNGPRNDWVDVEVWLGANPPCHLAVLTDSTTGVWEADFSSCTDITSDFDIRVLHYDPEGDSLVAHTEPVSQPLPYGIETGLTAIMNAALKQLEKGNEKAAVNQLNAYINKVEAQRGKKISEEQADMLIGIAQSLIEGIEE